MILKFILFVVVTYFAIKFISQLSKKHFTGSSQNFKQGDMTRLLACPQCGTYFQQNQGVSKQGITYCCQSCVKK
jgi:predicted RNA-binding Zn-ribbon protein involved in translation (DUF1610 family)